MYPHLGIDVRYCSCVDRHQQASGMPAETTWGLVWTAPLGTSLEDAVR